MLHFKMKSAITKQTHQWSSESIERSSLLSSCLQSIYICQEMKSPFEHRKYDFLSQSIDTLIDSATIADYFNS